jgi:hypothetical protein
VLLRAESVTVTVELSVDGPCPVSDATVMLTGPLVAPAGTEAVICVSLQLLTVAKAPLNCTVLVLWLAPKPLPLIVTDELTGPTLLASSQAHLRKKERKSNNLGCNTRRREWVVRIALNVL